MLPPVDLKKKCGDDDYQLLLNKSGANFHNVVCMRHTYDSEQCPI